MGWGLDVKKTSGHGTTDSICLGTRFTFPVAKYIHARYFYR